MVLRVRISWRVTNEVWRVLEKDIIVNNMLRSKQMR